MRLKLDLELERERVIKCYKVIKFEIDLLCGGGHKGRYLVVV